MLYVLITVKQTPLYTGIYYYEKDTGNKRFENFCKDFLRNDFKVKEHTSGELNFDRLFLVFVLPSVNRQNHVDVLYDFITETMEKLQLKGTDRS